MKIHFHTLVLSLFLLQSCNWKTKNDGTAIKDNSVFEQYSNDSIRNDIFKVAYGNASTAPSYVVFKAIDLNTKREKEICCEAPFLSGAIHNEFDLSYSDSCSKIVDSIILNNKVRTFEFKDTLALKNIGFETYWDIEYIETVSVLEDLEFFINKYGNNDSVGFLHYDNNRGYPQEIFAHWMFNCGILTTKDCVAGNNIWFGRPDLLFQKPLD